MYEKFFKKRLITVPVSHFYHTIIISPTAALTMTSWAVFTPWRKVNCLSLNTKKKKKKGKPSVRTFLSVPFTFMHCTRFFCLFTRSSVGRKIHTYDILKKSTMMTNIGMKYKLHQVLSLWPLPPHDPFFSSLSRSAADSSHLVHSWAGPSFVRHFGLRQRNGSTAPRCPRGGGCSFVKCTLWDSAPCFSLIL